MAKTVQSRKAKGRRLQQYVAEKVSDLLGIPYGKDELIRSREMGQSGTDVALLGLALERMPISIEAKNCEKWSVHEWIKQAKDNQKEGTDWVLICKRNNQDPVVIISDEYFWELQKQVLAFRDSMSANKEGNDSI